MQHHVTFSSTPSAVVVVVPRDQTAIALDDASDLSAREKQLLADHHLDSDGNPYGEDASDAGQVRVRFAGRAQREVPRDQPALPLASELRGLEERRTLQPTLNDIAESDSEHTVAVANARPRSVSRDRLGIRTASDLSLRELELLEQHVHVPDPPSPDESIDIESDDGSPDEDVEEARQARDPRPRSLSTTSAGRVTFSPLPAIVTIPSDQPHLHVLHKSPVSVSERAAPLDSERGTREDEEEEEDPADGLQMSLDASRLSDLSGKEVEMLSERGGEESKVTFLSHPSTVLIPKSQPVVPLDPSKLRRSRSTSRSRRSSPEVPIEDDGQVAQLGSHWTSDLSLREVDLLESKLATSSVRADEDDGVEEDVAEDRGNAEEREGTPGPMHRRLSIASLGGSGSFVKVTFSPRPAIVSTPKDQPTIPLSLPSSEIPILSARVVDGAVQVVGVEPLESEDVPRDLSGPEVELLSAKLSERGDEEADDFEDQDQEDDEDSIVDIESDGGNGNGNYGGDDNDDGPPPGAGGLGTGGAGGSGGASGSGGRRESVGDRDMDTGNSSEGTWHGQGSGSGDGNGNGEGSGRQATTWAAPASSIVPQQIEILDGAEDTDSSSSSDEDESWHAADRMSVDSIGDSMDPDSPISPPPAQMAPVYIPLRTPGSESTLAARSRSASPKSMLAIHRSVSGALVAGFSSISSVAGSVISAFAPKSGSGPVLEAPTLEAFAEYVRTKSPKFVVLTGAGISTNAGLSDFRSDAGLYARFNEWKHRINVPYPEAVFDLEYFRADPKPFYGMIRELFVGKGVPVGGPTMAHWFMRLLWEKGMLVRNYTQNIDSLEHLAGLPPTRVIESHGHFRTAHCAGRSSSGPAGIPEVIPPCGAIFPVSYIRESLEKTPWEVPMCHHCGGWVKPELTFFGETLPINFWDAARSDFEGAEALLVMGTSLQVQPFASLVDRVPKTVPRLMINREPPKSGPFRRAARRLDLWLGMARMGRDPRQVLKDDDSDLDYDVVVESSATGPGGAGHTYDAFNKMIEDFDFLPDEHESGKRDASKAKMRDAIFLGDCDDAVRELCRLLGWEADLLRVQAEGEARFADFKRRTGDGGWWSVFAFPDEERHRTPPDLPINRVGSEGASSLSSIRSAGPKSPAAPRSPRSQANDVWMKLQARFGVETPRECEFM